MKAKDSADGRSALSTSARNSSVAQRQKSPEPVPKPVTCDSRVADGETSALFKPFLPLVGPSHDARPPPFQGGAPSYQYGQQKTRICGYFISPLTDSNRRPPLYEEGPRVNCVF